MRLTPAQNAQSPSAFIEPGCACQRSASSEVNASAATIGPPAGVRDRGRLDDAEGACRTRRARTRTSAHRPPRRGSCRRTAFMSYGSMDSPKPCRRPSALRCSRVVLDDQLLRRLAQVPEEPLRHFQAVHHAARSWPADSAADRSRGGGGTPRGRRPSSSARPSPNCRCAASSSPRSARLLARPDLAQQRADERIEMRVQRGLVELVALQPQARQRAPAACRRRCWCGRSAGSSTCPPARPRPAGRRRPAASVRSTTRSAAITASGRQRRIARRRRQERLHARLRRIRRPHIQRLLVDVGDALRCPPASGKASTTTSR